MMNSLLLRLVLAGLGTFAVAALSIPPDAGSAGVALADGCCSKQGACAPCPPPPSRG